MEFQITTPSTITVRRNPRRKARDIPSSNAPDLPATTSKLSTIKPLSLEEILEPEPESEPNLSLSKPSDDDARQNLSVFLRILPLDLKPGPKKKSPNRGGPKSKAELEKDKLKKKKKIPDKQAICLAANDSHSVTLTVPPSLNESKHKKSEIYDGFSHVFNADSLQSEVYERVMEPLVSDFIKGKNRLLAALGPTGSGKTHTVFGCPREPGLVPLSLRQIYDQTSGIGGSSKVPRSLYLSMFEIRSERGKGERISDLSNDVADLCLQQSTIKGVKEVMVTDITQAERFIQCGLLKCSTAVTNSNNQSSRSQCIINIRSSSAMHGDEDGFAQNDAVLTIVDLAGAERERRTGIQSLLEHQKNPKKPLEKHFQNSLLTKYLKDYLEGKKRMTLIFTAKAGEDDYGATSYLLRQASLYMKIKFLNTEELPNMPCQKRHIPPSNRTSKLKQGKCSDVETFVGSSEIGGKCGKGVFETLGNGGNVIEEQLQELDLQQDSKALWNVLKQYKEKIEVLENEVQSLQEILRNMEKQLNKLKSSCSCHARSSNSESLDLKAESFNTIECTAEDLAGLEVNGKSPILDTTGCKPSIPSVTPCDLQVLDQEGSCVLTPYMDRNIFSDAMENDRSQLLLGSQELPASDVERSNRCQALCANGEKKHLNVEKARRKLLPASTMPVKEVGAFDMEDDNPRNNKRAENMATVGGRRQTHGSVSLLRLLRNNLSLSLSELKHVRTLLTLLSLEMSNGPELASQRAMAWHGNKAKAVLGRGGWARWPRPVRPVWHVCCPLWPSKPVRRGPLGTTRLGRPKVIFLK